MAPGGMFARVAQWLANEIIVKGLANNPAFQRFAVRSSEQAKNLTKQASEAAKNLAESESVMQMRKESEALKQQANDFASVLREEIGQAFRQTGEGRGPPPTHPKK